MYYYGKALIDNKEGPLRIGMTTQNVITCLLYTSMDMASSLQLILAFALAGGVLVQILGSVATETSHVDNLFPVSYTHLDVYKRQP